MCEDEGTGGEQEVEASPLGMALLSRWLDFGR